MGTTYPGDAGPEIVSDLAFSRQHLDRPGPRDFTLRPNGPSRTTFKNWWQGKRRLLPPRIRSIRTYAQFAVSGCAPIEGAALP